MLFPKYQEYFIFFFLQHNVLYVASIFERTMHGYDYNLQKLYTDRQTFNQWRVVTYLINSPIYKYPVKAKVYLLKYFQEIREHL